MRKVALLIALALFILHQDFWFWSDDHLVFGFMPVGLCYHACYSIAAALLWLFTIKFAWPSEVVAWAEDEDAGGEGASK